jgi:hypothetical protein
MSEWVFDRSGSVEHDDDGMRVVAYTDDGDVVFEVDQSEPTPAFVRHRVPVSVLRRLLDGKGES